MTTITYDDTQQICFATTDDAREIAIPYQAIASWKALLDLESYDEALNAIIEHTNPDTTPINWQEQYDALATRPDTNPQQTPKAMLLRAAPQTTQTATALAARQDILAALERGFIAKVKEGANR